MGTAINSLEPDVYLNDDESIYDYAVRSIDVEQVKHSNPRGLHQLLRFIHSIADAARSNNLRKFDPANQRCAICGGSNHTFDTCPGIPSDPASLRGAFIKLQLAVNKFVHASKLNIGRPNDIASQGLHAINAVCSFTPSHSAAPAPAPSAPSEPFFDHLAHAVLANHDAINSLRQELRSAYEPAPTAPDTDDDNSVSTTDTNGSIAAAAHALRHHSSRSSSGRTPDFRYGQR